MTTETDTTPSGWNVETLKQYFSTVLNEHRDAVAQRFTDVREQFLAHDLRYQQRFDASERALMSALTAAEKAVTAALSAAEKAVQKAEAASEKRFESVNEFRGALTDQTAALMPRVEVDNRLLSMSEKIADVARRLDRTEGSKDANHTSTTMMIAIVAVVISFVGVGASVALNFRPLPNPYLTDRNAAGAPR